MLFRSEYGPLCSFVWSQTINRFRTSTINFNDFYDKALISDVEVQKLLGIYDKNQPFHIMYYVHDKQKTQIAKGGKSGIYNPKIVKNIKIFELINTYITKKNVQSLNELDQMFPKIASLSSAILPKDDKRFNSKEIQLPSGEIIRITNQIGDKPTFPKNRNYSKLIDKLAQFGIK